MRNGAGWLCQNNWKGGIETLRLGTMAAIDINVEVTWAMTISRYMEKLYEEKDGVLHPTDGHVEIVPPGFSNDDTRHRTPMTHTYTPMTHTQAPQ